MKTRIVTILVAAVAAFAACTPGPGQGDAAATTEEATTDTAATLTATDTAAPPPVEAPTSVDGTREEAPDASAGPAMTDEEQAQAFLEELPGTYESREQWTVQYAEGATEEGPAVVLDVSRKEGTTIIAQKLQLDRDYGGGGGASEAEAAVLGIRKVGDAEYELKMEQRSCSSTTLHPFEGSKEFSDATKIPFTIRVDAGSSSRMRFKASRVNSACPNVWTLDRFKFKRKR